MASPKEHIEIVPATETSTPEGSRTMRFEFSRTLTRSIPSSRKSRTRDSYRYGSSPIFAPNLNRGLKWSLHAFTTPNNRELLHFILILQPCNVSTMTINCTLSLSDDSVLPARMSSVMVSNHKYKRSYKIKMFDAGSNDPSGAHERFVQGTMNISCVIKLTDYTFGSSASSSAAAPADPQLLHDMSRLLFEQKFSDVTITAGGKEFYVHKNVLSARSCVFEAMFEHEMTEKQENLVNVDDTEAEVFEEMLTYIYTGRAPNLDKMADRLLMAAEKYQLDRLKFMCEEVLHDKIAVENAADMLMIADIHNAKNLKKRAADFISGPNLTKILKTDSFRRLTTSRPVLMEEVLQAVATNEDYSTCHEGGSD